MPVPIPLPIPKPVAGVSSNNRILDIGKASCSSHNKILYIRTPYVQKGGAGVSPPQEDPLHGDAKWLAPHKDSYIWSPTVQMGKSMGKQTYTYNHTQTYAYTYTYTFAYTYTYTHAYTHIYTCTYTCTSPYTCNGCVASQWDPLHWETAWIAPQSD